MTPGGRIGCPGVIAIGAVVVDLFAGLQLLAQNLFRTSLLRQLAASNGAPIKLIDPFDYFVKLGTATPKVLAAVHLKTDVTIED